MSQTAEPIQTSNTEYSTSKESGPWSLRLGPTWALVLSAFVVCLFLLLRLKLRYLFVFDTVNFAWSLEDFNVGLHHPHPPGYPGFVLITRLLHKLLPDPTEVFFVSGMIALGIAAYILMRLGREIGSIKAGVAAAVLLIFNISSTESVLVSPVRNYLGVVSALVALLAWVAIKNRSAASFYWCVIALAIGSSFRPELTATLFPLVLFVAIHNRIPIRTLAVALMLYLALIALWIYPTAKPIGGFVEYGKLLKSFFAFQAQAAAERDQRDGGIAWLYMFWKATLWTFGSVVTWIWVLASSRNRQLWATNRKLLLFFACWIIPGYLFSCFFHIAAAGHALATVTGLCMLGGLVLGSIDRDVLFVGALVVAAFLNVEILKHPVVAYEEGSPQHLKSLNDNEGRMLDELRGLGGSDDLFVITDSSTLSWRTILYYLRNTRVLVLDGIVGGDAVLFNGNEVQRIDTKSLHIPPCGVIAWLVEDIDSLKQQTADFKRKDWNGSVYLTQGSPKATAKERAFTFQSDLASACQAK